MRIQFLGGARNVTGSQHLLEAGGARILLDCGLFQGRRSEAIKRNTTFVFDPSSIDAVILSHAHMDHCGKLPMLEKSGFRGTIYCTHATRDLAGLMLRDSAHIQLKDAEYLNRHLRDGEPRIEPLYDTEDVQRVLQNFVGISYGKSFQPMPNVRVTFADAGHILGSAITRMEISENGLKTTFAFTGDVGVRDVPIIRDPEGVGEVDAMICESTYGNRLHGTPAAVKDQLANFVARVAGRGGKMIVPAFAMGRTQALIYVLHELSTEGRLPGIPIFVDSPLGVNITDVFKLHPECFDRETLKLLESEDDPFGFAKVRYIRDVEESKSLNGLKTPCMIISSSGMCEAGRILHHLKNGIEDPRNMIMMTGFQAENTLGRRMMEGMKRVRLLGREFDVRAEVVVLDGLSSHADRDGLVDYVTVRSKPGRVFLVHGEPEAADALANTLKGTGLKDVMVPSEGEVATL